MSRAKEGYIPWNKGLLRTKQWMGRNHQSHCYLARKVWEEYWREEVPKGYIIHHVDRDYTNNDICNLALLTHSYHARIHGRGKNRWRNRA